MLVHASYMKLESKLKLNWKSKSTETKTKQENNGKRKQEDQENKTETETETETPPYPTFLTNYTKIKRTQNRTKTNEVHVHNLFLCEVEEVPVAQVDSPNNM